MSEPWKSEPDPDDDAPDYALVMPFLDESPSFCHGFEAGREGGRMEFGPRARYSQAIHLENQRQLAMLAKRFGWRLRFEPLDDTFATMHAEPREVHDV